MGWVADWQVLVGKIIKADNHPSNHRLWFRAARQPVRAEERTTEEGVHIGQWK